MAVRVTVLAGYDVREPELWSHLYDLNAGEQNKV